VYDESGLMITNLTATFMNIAIRFFRIELNIMIMTFCDASEPCTVTGSMQYITPRRIVDLQHRYPCLPQYYNLGCPSSTKN
jgi:hypothetical protein